jgi:hypothetical protein
MQYDRNPFGSTGECTYESLQDFASSTCNFSTLPLPKKQLSRMVYLLTPSSLGCIFNSTTPGSPSTVILISAMTPPNSFQY